MPKIVFYFTVAFVVISSLYIFTSPVRVVNKTLQTDNIIYNYEWFHDTYSSFLSRKKQILQYKNFFNEEKDQEEKNRMRMEMAAIQQSCREIVSKYNANATKSNRSIFMGNSLPTNLDINECE